MVKEECPEPKRDEVRLRVLTAGVGFVILPGRAVCRSGNRRGDCARLTACSRSVAQSEPFVLTLSGKNIDVEIARARLVAASPVAKLGVFLHSVWSKKGQGKRQKAKGKREERCASFVW